MRDMPPPSFLLIVQLHQLQAMLSLGVIPNPATGQPNPVDQTRARHELALLEILREKTNGNLDDEEDTLLVEVIHSLRTALGETED